MKTFVGRVALLAVAAVPAGADLALLSGVQSSVGEVLVARGFEQIIESYDLTADDPLASWTPPDQDIQVIWDQDYSARIHSRYASAVTPQGVALRTDVPVAYAQGPHSGAPDSRFDYTQTFEIRFSIAEPTPVLLSAKIMSLFFSGWWGNTADIRMRFGREGDQPIFSWTAADLDQWTWTAAFPATELLLQPGTYTVSASSQDDWTAGGSHSANSRMSFSLQVIPAPGTLGPLAFALVLGRRRR